MQLKQSNDSENNTTGNLQTTAKCVCNRSPLTGEEIGIICASLGFAQISPVEVARAVEAAHGIGGQP